jgi:hypothetical protein
VERAKKHITDFGQARITFLEGNPYLINLKYRPELNVTEYVLGPLPEMPIDLSLMAGDAAHNLRIALDYLACELVKSANATPKAVYFPICETAEKYKTESPGKTRGMPVAAKQIIDRIEPYGGANNPLWALHLLDIADKHRLLVAVGTKVANQNGMQFQLSPEPTQFSVLVDSPALKEGDVLGEVSGNSEAQQRISFNFDVAFGEPDLLAGEPIVETLEYMTQMVEAILNHFSTQNF